MDYKKLLWKYITHIGGCEGISYLSEHHTKGGEWFSDDELEELRRIECAEEGSGLEFDFGKVCRHILGHSEGVDESWLVYEEKEWMYNNIVFEFCPKCGAKLDTQPTVS